LKLDHDWVLRCIVRKQTLVVSHPQGLIETNVITATSLPPRGAGVAAGSVIPLIDWSGEASSAGVNVTLARAIAFSTATLASGGAVAVAGALLAVH
jgi:hypothetical protein